MLMQYFNEHKLREFVGGENPKIERVESLVHMLVGDPNPTVAYWLLSECELFWDLDPKLITEFFEQNYFINSNGNTYRFSYRKLNQPKVEIINSLNNDAFINTAPLFGDKTLEYAKKRLDMLNEEEYLHLLTHPAWKIHHFLQMLQYATENNHTVVDLDVLATVVGKHKQRRHSPNTSEVLYRYITGGGDNISYENIIKVPVGLLKYMRDLTSSQSEKLVLSQPDSYVTNAAYMAIVRDWFWTKNWSMETRRLVSNKYLQNEPRLPDVTKDEQTFYATWLSLGFDEVSDPSIDLELAIELRKHVEFSVENQKRYTYQLSALLGSCLSDVDPDVLVTYSKEILSNVYSYGFTLGEPTKEWLNKVAAWPTIVEGGDYTLEELTGEILAALPVATAIEYFPAKMLIKHYDVFDESWRISDLIGEQLDQVAAKYSKTGVDLLNKMIDNSNQPIDQLFLIVDTALNSK